MGCSLGRKAVRAPVAVGRGAAASDDGGVAERSPSGGASPTEDCRRTRRAARPRAKNLDFGGFGSISSLLIRGWSPLSDLNSPKI